MKYLLTEKPLPSPSGGNSSFSSALAGISQVMNDSASSDDTYDPSDDPDNLSDSDRGDDLNDEGFEVSKELLVYT